jgi:glutamate--cysteine ligase catalytic subunit
MEVQMTDFENAAFAVFVVLLSRAILSFNLNFYIPISKVPLGLGLMIMLKGALKFPFLGRREHGESTAERCRRFRKVLLSERCSP